MRIILMLRRVLSFLLICALACQAAGAGAIGAAGEPAQQACHDSQQPTESSSDTAGTIQCAMHCLGAVAVPSIAIRLFVAPSGPYERTCVAVAPTRFDAPPLPPPIR
jgi:hypothetical protein